MTNPINFLLSVFLLTFFFLSSSLLPSVAASNGSVLLPEEHAVTTRRQAEEESLPSKAIEKFRVHIKKKVGGGVRVNGTGSAKAADIPYSTAVVCMLGYLLLLGFFFV